MSLIDLIRRKPQTVAAIADVAVASDKGKDATYGTVAAIADVAVAPPLSTPATATKVVATIEEIIINSSSATAIGAIPATDNPASTAPVHLEDLPPSLIDAATRVCRELHNDGPEQVQAMIDDLRHYPADSWDWLIDHFTAQLPAITDTPPTCGACQHSRPTRHPAILECGRGVLSGLPIGGRWSTDPHNCEQFTDRSTVATRKPVITTRDTTPTTTRDPSYDPFTE